jgi:hypothetical protein
MTVVSTFDGSGKRPLLAGVINLLAATAANITVGGLQSSGAS